MSFFAVSAGLIQLLWLKDLRRLTLFQLESETESESTWNLNLNEKYPGAADILSSFHNTIPNPFLRKVQGRFWAYQHLIITPSQLVNICCEDKLYLVYITYQSKRTFGKVLQCPPGFLNSTHVVFCDFSCPNNKLSDDKKCVIGFYDSRWWMSFVKESSKFKACRVRNISSVHFAVDLCFRL
jgi:hypothetical protein